MTEDILDKLEDYEAAAGSDSQTLNNTDQYYDNQDYEKLNLSADSDFGPDRSINNLTTTLPPDSVSLNKSSQVLVKEENVLEVTAYDFQVSSG